MGRHFESEQTWRKMHVLESDDKAFAHKLLRIQRT